MKRIRSKQQLRAARSYLSIRQVKKVENHDNMASLLDSRRRDSRMKIRIGS
jgi:ribosomal protein L20A (L18A)